jgi:dihydropyrimidinase
VTLSKSILHEQVDYTPYEGMQLTGFPVMTFLRGKQVADHGKFTGSAGDGQYLPRERGS